VFKKKKSIFVVVSGSTPRKMDLVDIGIYVENNLKKEWSSCEFAQRFFNSSNVMKYLEQAISDFPSMENATKCRLLLSLLSLPNKSLSSLWKLVNDLLRVASMDTDDWVVITLALVKRSLPPSKDLLESEDDAEPPVSEAVFWDAVEEATELIKSGSKSCNTKSLSSEFVPWEWPFLCEQLIPTQIETRNPHFTPCGGSVPSEAENVAEEPNSAPTVTSNLHSAEMQQKIKLEAEKLKLKFERKQSMKAASSIDIGLLKVPDTIRAVLKNPENDKLTSQGRDSVIQFHDDAAPKRTGQELVLLAETREFADNSNTIIIITQVNLKLDHDQHTVKRIKTTKKIKLANPLESPSAS